MNKLLYRIEDALLNVKAATTKEVIILAIEVAILFLKLKVLRVVRRAKEVFWYASGGAF